MLAEDMGFFMGNIWGYVWRIGLILLALILTTLTMIAFCGWPFSKKTEENNRQATIPNVLAIKQVRHLHHGDGGWVTESAIWVDNQSKMWIINESEIFNEKSTLSKIKVIFSKEKSGFCIEVPSKSRWKVGEYSSFRNRSYPIVEVVIINEVQ
jgi:hypothetical protein